MKKSTPHLINAIVICILLCTTFAFARQENSPITCTYCLYSGALFKEKAITNLPVSEYIDYYDDIKIMVQNFNANKTEENSASENKNFVQTKAKSNARKRKSNEKRIETQFFEPLTQHNLYPLLQQLTAVDFNSDYPENFEYFPEKFDSYWESILHSPSHSSMYTICKILASKGLKMGELFQHITKPEITGNLLGNVPEKTRNFINHIQAQHKIYEGMCKRISNTNPEQKKEVIVTEASPLFIKDPPLNNSPKKPRHSQASPKKIKLIGLNLFATILSSSIGNTEQTPLPQQNTCHNGPVSINLMEFETWFNSCRQGASNYKIDGEPQSCDNVLPRLFVPCSSLPYNCSKEHGEFGCPKNFLYNNNVYGFRDRTFGCQECMKQRLSGKKPEIYSCCGNKRDTQFYHNECEKIGPSTWPDGTPGENKTRRLNLDNQFELQKYYKKELPLAKEFYNISRPNCVLPCVAQASSSTSIPTEAMTYSQFNQAPIQSFINSRSSARENEGNNKEEAGVVIGGVCSLFIIAIYVYCSVFSKKNQPTEQARHKQYFMCTRCIPLEYYNAADTNDTDNEP